jgi:hypothetical protein
MSAQKLVNDLFNAILARMLLTLVASPGDGGNELRREGGLMSDKQLD